MRVFAIEHFHHLATMAIGVAMLGFGASGVLLAVTPSLKRWGLDRVFASAAALTPITLVLSPALAHRIPFDPTQLAWDPAAWTRLAAVYALLALPFGAGALGILAALAAEPDHPGRIYGASLCGSGLGAALGLAVLWVALPERALALPALLAAAAAVLAVSGSPRRGATALVASVSLAAAVWAVLDPPWRIEVTPYKGLPQVEAYPGARRVAERSSPVGWLVAVDAPAFRYAPGLSLGFRGEFPRQTALFVDGSLSGALSEWTSAREAHRFLDALPTALPYALGGRRRVLVLGAGGGMEVENAEAHGARDVTAVELHPDLARVSRASGSLSRLGDGARVRWAVGDARSFVARSRERFDLITLGVGGAFGGSGAGIHALDADFLHTTDGYVSCLRRVSDGGVLSVTRWLTVPPREAARAVLTAAEALHLLTGGAVSGGLVVVRSWATATVLVKPSGFAPQEIDSLRAWCSARRFDLDWYPGLASRGEQFNVLEGDALFDAARAAVAGAREAARFASRYPFDVAPAGDARPYPHHFLRGRSLGAFLHAGWWSTLPFAEWGYVALAATLIQGGLIATVLMVLPAALRGRRGRSRPLLPLVAYFGAIGLAFLAVQIAALEQLSLLLGHPVYAVTAVLTAMLLASGAGSLLSDRVDAAHGAAAGFAIAVLLALGALLLLPVIRLIQPAPLPARAVAAALVLAPPSLLMGLLFPLGLRRLTGGDPGGVAWAWAANGFASVIAAPLSALIALDLGSRALFMFAALGYGLAALLIGAAAWKRSDSATLP